MTYKTEQEQFWAGRFGDEYVERVHETQKRIASNLYLFSKILGKTSEIQSVIEFGANIGLNLKAIHQLLPDAQLSAIEINSKAVDVLKSRKEIAKIHESSIFDYKPKHKMDFAFIKGVLIHINPEMLNEAYSVIYESSKKYICIAEYYNPTPVTIPYRGNEERLFKRDFAGEFLEIYQDVKLIDYGFQYRRDLHYPQDDITWFLLEKQSMEI